MGRIPSEQQTAGPGHVPDKLQAEILSLLFKHSRGVHIATSVAAVLLSLAFWETPAGAVIPAWLGYILCVEAIRAILSQRFRHVVLAPRAIVQWRRIFHVGNLLSALGWGAAGFLLLPADSAIHQTLTAATLIGICGIAIPILAASFSAYLAFVSVTVLPVVVQFVLLGSEDSLFAAGLCAAGVGVLGLVAWRMHQDLLEAVRARLAYAEMAEEYDQELTTRLRVEDTIRRGNKRSRKQNYLLLALAREESIASGDLNAALRVITAKAVQAVESSRVSVWFCDPDFSEFRCMHIFSGGEHESDPGFVLNTAGQVRIYKRLARIRSFAVTDVEHDPRTRAFWDPYLRPFRVTSLLGAPIQQGGLLRGIICHEHVGLPRRWSREERAFISSLADFVSLALTSSGRQRAQEELRQLANFDRLTGLPNRAMFQDRLHHALEKARRNDTQMALLFVDVDHFKKVNDSLGHALGDRVLRSIGKRLVRCVRDADTVARLGGDEFTVILEDVEQLETIISVADRIIETAAEPLLFGENEITLTYSIGISHFPGDGDSAEKLLQNADAAMYRSKRLGRNRYQFFTEDLHTAALQRIARETELRHALQRQELVLFYQPQIDTRDGKLVGLEALVRWRHPVNGLMSPLEFIGLAEEAGLIAYLGEWVLREACRQAEEWRQRYGGGFHIGVNLSVGQFYTRNMPQMVDTILRETGLPREMLLLEITESLAMEDAEMHLQVLSELKDLGIRLALDDFGTGNSSLSYLKNFPVDMLKIDQTFVRDLGHDVHDEAIARATIGLAESLGLEVIAEGVETERHRKWLEAEGCVVMQGYLFSRPLKPEDCAPWFAVENGHAVAGGKGRS